MRRPNAVQTCLGSSRRVTGEKSPVFYLFPSRQQPIHFITVPILRDDRFKTIFLQVYTLFCWDGLRYCSINDYIHQFAGHFHAGFGKSRWISSVFVVAFGDDMGNAKAFFEVVGWCSWITKFEADWSEGAEEGIINIRLRFHHLV